MKSRSGSPANWPGRHSKTKLDRRKQRALDRLEIEARTARVKELQERVSLVEKLRALGAVPVWDSHGSMAVVNAPHDYDWDELTRRLISATDLSETPTDQAPIKAEVRGRGTLTGDLRTLRVSHVIEAGGTQATMILQHRRRKTTKNRANVTCNAPARSNDYRKCIRPALSLVCKRRGAGIGNRIRGRSNRSTFPKAAQPRPYRDPRLDHKDARPS